LKLIIRRDQKAQKGLFGGHAGMKFILTYRVQLTPDEEALVKKYKAEYHPLLFVTKDGERVPSDTVSSLLREKTGELDDVTILLTNEEHLKSACRNFKTLLEVMATFGGEEVLEF